MSADLLEYRQRLEKPLRRCVEGEARLLSMQNERDDGFKRARAQQKQHQLRTALACALRGIYLTYMDNQALIDAIKVDADIEARKVFSCGNE